MRWGFEPIEIFFFGRLERPKAFLLFDSQSEELTLSLTDWGGLTVDELAASISERSLTEEDGVILPVIIESSGVLDEEGNGLCFVSPLETDGTVCDAVDFDDLSNRLLSFTCGEVGCSGKEFKEGIYTVTIDVGTWISKEA